MILRIKKLHPDAKWERAYEHAAGLDLFCVEDTRVMWQDRGEPVDIPTGIAVSLPPGFCGLLMERSSGWRSGCDMRNKVGLIDPDYRGEVKVRLTPDFWRAHLARETPVVKKGDKIAQLVLVAYHSPEIKVVDDLDETVRGERGFGSSDALRVGGTVTGFWSPAPTDMLNSMLVGAKIEQVTLGTGGTADPNMVDIHPITGTPWVRRGTRWLDSRQVPDPASAEAPSRALDDAHKPYPSSSRAAYEEWIDRGGRPDEWEKGFGPR